MGTQGPESGCVAVVVTPGCTVCVLVLPGKMSRRSPFNLCVQNAHKLFLVRFF